MALFGNAYQFMDQLEHNLPEIRYPDRSYRPPDAAENELGAWYVRTDLKGKEFGTAQGQDGRNKGQHFRRQCSHDERRLDT